MLLSGIYKLVKAWPQLMASRSQAADLGAALVVAGLVGYATIPWLLAFLRKHSMFVFIVYRLLLAALLLWLLTSGRLAP